MESLPLGARAKQGLAVLALEARGWGFREGVDLAWAWLLQVVVEWVWWG